MKKVILIIASIAFLSTSVMAQKWFTRSAHLSFYSEAPLENIEAHNYQGTSIINTETGDVAFSLLIKGFEFEKALMQEHFNEKYLHSDEYPKSTFEGKIVNMDAVDFSKNGTYDAVVEGDLMIHGVTKKVKATGTITVKDDKITVESKFPVTLADYNVTIPSVVKNNISEVVDVTVNAAYKPYNK